MGQAHTWRRGKTRVAPAVRGAPVIPESCLPTWLGVFIDGPAGCSRLPTRRPPRLRRRGLPLLLLLPPAHEAIDEVAGDRPGGQPRDVGEVQPGEELR